MKKLYFLFTLTLTLLFSSINVNANTNFCYNLKASVGESIDQVGIIYHSDVEGTEVHYGLDSHLSDYKIVKPTETVYGKGQTNGQPETVFKNRFVCRVNLSDLYEDATYYYQVVYQNEKSQIQSFRTPSSHKLTFGVLCDTQSSGSTFQQSNELVNKLVQINQNINFFMIAGDIVDRGGYEEQWNSFEQYMTTINRNYLFATIPGNHELYHSSNPSYIDASIYNQYFYNPQNGPEVRKNSSYYFVQNDVLFIMLDIMHRSDNKNYNKEQIEWFKQVVQNVPSKFVIVMSHPGCYSTGVYDGDAEIVNGNWRKVFEECGVDLAISGHEHIYARTQPLYDNKVDSEKGVTYVIGGSAGQKSYSAIGKGMFDVVIETEEYGQYSGSICEIVDDTLTMSFYRKNGTVKDTFTIKSKRTIDKNFDIDNFMDSIKVEYDEKTYQNKIIWNDNGYGNIQKIDVVLKYKNNDTITSFYGPKSNCCVIGISYPTKDYEYEVIVYTYDGAEYKKDLLLDNDESLNTPSNMKLDIKERTDKPGTYDVELTYQANNTSLISLTLFVDGKKYSLDSGSCEITSQKPITEDDIKIELFYQLFNNGNLMDFDKNNMEISITNNPVEENPNNNPNNNQNNNQNQQPIGCQFGFVTLMPLLAAGTLLIIKRKH